MAKLPGLLSLASYSGQIEAEFVAESTPPERQAIGVPDDWAAKDLVAHVTTWRQRGAEDLKAILRGPLPPEPQEFDEVNRAIFDQNHGQAWEVVLGRVKKPRENFTMALRDLTEDMLAASGGEAQPGRPVWRRVTVDAGNHPVLHFAEFPRRRGRGASASWHGVVNEIPACRYAQTGMAERALDSPPCRPRTQSGFGGMIQARPRPGPLGRRPAVPCALIAHVDFAVFALARPPGWAQDPLPPSAVAARCHSTAVLGTMTPIIRIRTRFH